MLEIRAKLALIGVCPFAQPGRVKSAALVHRFKVLKNITRHQPPVAPLICLRAELQAVAFYSRCSLRQGIGSRSGVQILILDPIEGLKCQRKLTPIPVLNSMVEQRAGLLLRIGAGGQQRR